MIEFKSIKHLKFKTIYKENLFKQIVGIVKKPENFSKNSAARQRALNEKLKNLTILNEFTQIFRDEELKLPHLKKEFEIFKKVLKESILKKKKLRSNSAGIESRIRQCIQLIITDLIEKGYIDYFDKEKVIEKLNYSRFFHMCISIIFSCVEYTSSKEENFEYKGDLNENDVIYVKFLYRLQTGLYLHIISIIVEGHNQMSEILKEAYDDHRTTTLQTKLFYELSNQIGEILMFSLGIHNEIREIPTIDEKGRFKSTNIVRLPENIFKEFIPAAHLPQIVEPNVTYKSVNDYLLYQKRVKNGISSMNLSEKTVEALKISQKKKFRINEEAIKLFDYLDNCPYEQIKYIKSLPFVPLSVFPHLESEIKKLRPLVDNEKKIKYIKLLKENKDYNKKKKEKEKKYIKFEEHNMSTEEIENIQKLHKLETEYKRKVNLRYMHNTILRFAKIFEGFPIYFINTLDYRGRMYPWNFMFNRSSGIYKYLLIEFSKQRIKVDILDMMKKVFCKSVGIKEFFLNKQEIIIKHKKKFFYYILLGTEIERLIKQKNVLSTNFMMEIDQKSSSSVLLSLILGDRELAKDSNIFEKSSIDPPTKLMIKSKEYFKNLIKEGNLKILSTTRDIHKFLMMCLNYNQTFYGRKKKVLEYIKDYDDAETIAKIYEEYVDSVYSNLSKKKEIFNNIVRYYLNNSGGYKKPIIIDTIDASRVEWNIFPKKKKNKSNTKKKFKSPLTDEFKSYHFEEFETTETQKQKILTGILPSFIHSIDGAIMRLIIVDVYENNQYIINHLHDSIQYNPKYYKEVLESIRNVYSGAMIHKCLDDKFLVHLRSRLLEEQRKEFDGLVRELKNCNFEEVIIDKKKFQAENMFPHE